ncbi:MAG: metal-dependent hydrolase [Theionarchaea archaeon]|nr:metal-dependent hydrolase [Theionarchaea archaeon]
MDLISHAFLGYVMGRGLQLDKKTRLLFIIACIFPDFDSVSLLAGWEAFSQFHRGPSHSLVGGILISVALAVVFIGVVHLPSRKGLLIFLLCICGFASHVVLDVLTPWGTEILWPFSREGIAFYVTYFFDPIFFSVFFLAFLIIHFTRFHTTRNVRFIAVTALLLVSMNFGIRYYERDIALKTVDIPSTVDVMSQPTIRLDRWWVIAKTSFNNGYIYDIYGVDSLGKTVLTHTTVESPFINYEMSEPPLDSPEKAVSYSRKDRSVQIFIEDSDLPAVKTTLEGYVWTIVWYDAMAETQGGMSREMLVILTVDGTFIKVEMVQSV